MEFEIAQDASSLKWFYFTDGLMDTAHVFNTEKEAIACAVAAPEMKAALQNLVDRDLIKDIEGDHYDEVLDVLAKSGGK